MNKMEIEELNERVKLISDTKVDELKIIDS